MNKLIRNTLMILFFIFLIILFLVNILLPKIYFYKSNQEIKKEVQNIYIKDDYILDNEELTLIKLNMKSNIDSLNDDLRWKLEKEQLKINNIWISKEIIKEIKNKNIVRKIYKQDKLKISLLTNIFMKDNSIYLIAKPVVYSYEIIKILNFYISIILLISFLLNLLVVLIFSSKMIKNINTLEDSLKNISELEFKKIDEKTGDEMDKLIYSFNNMTDVISAKYDELDEKNKNLKLFFSNITHEFKTPLSLIKAYALGIEDEIFDLNYIKKINENVNKIDNLLDKLLNSIKYDFLDLNKAVFDFIEILDYSLLKNEELLKEYTLEIKNDIKDLYIKADKESMLMVLDNLISNAIKHSKDKKIFFEIFKINESFVFEIKNNTSSYTLNKDDIIKPFYCFESKKENTGLGLFIVDNILKKHNIRYEIDLSNDFFSFRIYFVRLV